MEKNVKYVEKNVKNVKMKVIIVLEGNVLIPQEKIILNVLVFKV